jgi:hypothetical protein
LGHCRTLRPTTQNSIRPKSTQYLGRIDAALVAVPSLVVGFKVDVSVSKCLISAARTLLRQAFNLDVRDWGARFPPGSRSTIFRQSEPFRSAVAVSDGGAMRRTKSNPPFCRPLRSRGADSEMRAPFGQGSHCTLTPSDILLDETCRRVRRFHPPYGHTAFERDRFFRRLIKSARLTLLAVVQG